MHRTKPRLSLALYQRRPPKRGRRLRLLLRLRLRLRLHLRLCLRLRLRLRLPLRLRLRHLLRLLLINDLRYTNGSKSIC